MGLRLVISETSCNTTYALLIVSRLKVNLGVSFKPSHLISPPFSPQNPDKEIPSVSFQLLSIGRHANCPSYTYMYGQASPPVIQ